MSGPDTSNSESTPNTDPLLPAIDKFVGSWQFTEVSKEGYGDCSDTLTLTIDFIDVDVLRISKRYYHCGSNTTGIKTKDLIVDAESKLLYAGRTYGGAYGTYLTYNMSSSGCVANFRLEFHPDENYMELYERFGCPNYNIPIETFTSRGVIP